MRLQACIVLQLRKQVLSCTKHFASYGYRNPIVTKPFLDLSTILQTFKEELGGLYLLPFVPACCDCVTRKNFFVVCFAI